MLKILKDQMRQEKLKIKSKLVTSSILGRKLKNVAIKVIFIKQYLNIGIKYRLL